MSLISPATALAEGTFGLAAFLGSRSQEVVRAKVLFGGGADAE